MLSVSDRQAAVLEMMKVTDALKDGLQPGVKSQSAEIGIEKGDADIKGIIEAFHSGNVFVAPAQKPKEDCEISEKERSHITASVIAGMHKLYGL